MLFFMRSFNAIALLVISFLLFCASSAHADDAAYALGVGDSLAVQVYNEPYLDGVYRIQNDGAIRLPLIGSIPMIGLTLSAAQAAVEAALSDGYLRDPQILLKIDAYRPFYILGEVQSPGQYKYEKTISVLNAVAIARGYTYRANQKRFKILRAGTALNAQGHRDYVTIGPQDVVLPGDVLLVQERFF